MPQSSGTIYLSARLFVEKGFGEEAVERILAELDDEARSDLSGMTAVGKYEIQPMLDFHRLADEMFGDGSGALVRDIGRFGAEWQFNTFHRIFLRMRRPTYLLERATSMWSRYHDSGHWEIENPDASQVVARLCDFRVDEVFCRRLEGWLTRAFELCGAKNVELREYACAGRGHPHCEYRGGWE